jgi:hypothetical protein
MAQRYSRIARFWANAQKLFPEARWQSGHAAACKAVYAGSIPTLASIYPFLGVLFCLKYRIRASEAFDLYMFGGFWRIVVVSEVGLLKRSIFGSICKSTTFKCYFSCGDHLWRRTGVKWMSPPETNRRKVGNLFRTEPA